MYRGAGRTYWRLRCRRAWVRVYRRAGGGSNSERRSEVETRCAGVASRAAGGSGSRLIASRDHRPTGRRHRTQAHGAGLSLLCSCVRCAARTHTPVVGRTRFRWCGDRQVRSTGRRRWRLADAGPKGLAAKRPGATAKCGRPTLAHRQWTWREALIRMCGIVQCRWLAALLEYSLSSWSASTGSIQV